MNKKTFFIVVISLILILAGLIYWSLTNYEKSEQPPESTEPAATAPSHEEAELVGYNFMLDFVKIAPPQTDSEAEDRVYQSLSSRAKGQVDRQTIIGDMAGFVGIQDVPGQGVSVEDLQIVDDQTAILILGLNYSGGRAIRWVYLVVEDGQWKVDKVTEPAEGALFDQTGNLTRDNPGLEAGFWYLVYEMPGQPALTKQLLFESSSVCAQRAENMTCQTETFSQGEKVRIIGEETDGQVRVVRLEHQ